MAVSSLLHKSLIKGFNSWLGQTAKHFMRWSLSLVTLGAKVIHALTGTQDYFPAIQPGLNIIHYRASGVKTRVALGAFR